MVQDREIVMLTNAIAPDKLGGLERYVRELSAALVRSGRRVSILTKRVNLDDPLEEIGVDGVRIVRHRVPTKERPTFALEYPFAVAAGIRHGLHEVSPEAIIHGHYAFTSLPVSLSRRPYLQTFHAPVHKEVLAERGGSYLLPGPVQRASVRSVREAERLVVSRATSNVVLSEFMRRELSELSARAGARALVIPGGIDTDWFCPGPGTQDPWATHGAPLLFAARRLTERTGVVELVEAMVAVRATLPGVRLAIAGEGHQRADVEQAIARHDLSSSIRLLGRISEEDLRSWYQAADLVITPTQELEGFGLATAEAMACGTPCVVTPVGANTELVHALDPMLVTHDPSPAGLAEGIVRLVQSGRLAMLGDDARSIVTHAWSWDSVATSYLEVYATMKDR